MIEETPVLRNYQCDKSSALAIPIAGRAKLTVNQHLHWLEGPDKDGNEHRIDCPAYTRALADAGQPDDARYMQALGTFADFIDIVHYQYSDEVGRLVEQLTDRRLSYLDNAIKEFHISEDGILDCEMWLSCLDKGKTNDTVAWLSGQLEPLAKSIAYHSSRSPVKVTGDAGGIVKIHCDLRTVPVLKEVLSQLLADTLFGQEQPINNCRLIVPQAATGE